MKQVFAKLGIHKMDEMEKNIALKAQRNALIYLIGALLVWSLYESYKAHIQNSSVNLVPSFLLVTTALVLIFSQMYLQNQAVKGDDEYQEENPFYKLILGIAIIVGVIVSIGSWILMAGR